MLLVSSASGSNPVADRCLYVHVCPLISLISLLLRDEPARMDHSRREDGSITAASSSLSKVIMSILTDCRRRMVE